MRCRHTHPPRNSQRLFLVPQRPSRPASAPPTDAEIAAAAVARFLKALNPLDPFFTDPTPPKS